MTVLDAYALLAFLRAEPSADDVAEILGQPASISAANATEVADQLIRVDGRNPDDVYMDMRVLAHLVLDFVPVTAEISVNAGLLRARNYRSKSWAVSLADCLAAATSLSLERPLATADPALAAMLRSEGGTVHPLPDSLGRRP